jgi:hypothetical protein
MRPTERRGDGVDARCVCLLPSVLVHELTSSCANASKWRRERVADATLGEYLGYIAANLKKRKQLAVGQRHCRHRRHSAGVLRTQVRPIRVPLAVSKPGGVS